MHVNFEHDMIHVAIMFTAISKSYVAALMRHWECRKFKKPSSEKFTTATYASWTYQQSV